MIRISTYVTPFIVKLRIVLNWPIYGIEKIVAALIIVLVEGQSAPSREVFEISSVEQLTRPPTTHRYCLLGEGFVSRALPTATVPWAAALRAWLYASSVNQARRATIHGTLALGRAWDTKPTTREQYLRLLKVQSAVRRMILQKIFPKELTDPQQFLRPILARKI